MSTVHTQLDRSAERKAPDGTALASVNPKNQVPALMLDDGQVLTEGPVIARYLADKAPASGLLPPPGTMERCRVEEWQNFVASELHKTFGPLFRPTTPEEYKALSRDYLAHRFNWIDQELAGKQYLTGDVQGLPGASLQLDRPGARREAILDRRQIHRRRRLSLHSAALVAARRR